MKDFYFAVGHGLRPDGTFDPGARGADGRYEHHEVHEIAAEIANAAIRCGLSFRMEGYGTDSDGEDPNFVGSINNVNNDPGGYRCAIEGHFDWMYGPESFVALHSGSRGGSRLASDLASGARAEGLDLGGAGGQGHAQDDQYGRKVRLAFVRRTHPPAALVEYGRVADHPAGVNRDMAEATVRGICQYVGKAYVTPRASDMDYAVAVVWGGDPDYGLAAMLGKRHQFKVLQAQQVLSGKVSVGYAVAIGRQREEVVAYVGDGLAIGGKDRTETADQVYAKLMSQAPDRRRPWA